MITKSGRHIECEPAVEAEIRDDPRYETAEGCYALARLLYRRAKQLYVRGNIIKLDSKGIPANVIQFPLPPPKGLKKRKGGIHGRYERIP